MNGLQEQKTVETPVQNGNYVQSRGGLSGSTLKMIAIITMFIDHFGAIMFESRMRINFLDYYRFLDTDMKLRAIGRLGFPLFAFLLVEGVTHTRNMKRYIRNMIIFCFVSELPFNLGFFGQLLYPDYQNVFFTLTIGVIVLAVIQWAEKKEWAGSLKVLPWISSLLVGPTAVYLAFKTQMVEQAENGYEIFQSEFFMVTAISAIVSLVAYLIIHRKWKDRTINLFAIGELALAVGVLVAEGLKTDYSGWGVFTIFVMYVFRKNRMLAAGLGCLALTAMSSIETYAFAILLPIYFYNGKRGIKLKYFFYIFYPAHILILYLVAHYLGYVGFAIK